MKVRHLDQAIHMFAFEKYLDLALEIKALWGMKKVVISPIVIGVLGNFTERLEGYLNNIKTRLSKNPPKGPGTLRLHVAACSGLTSSEYCELIFPNNNNINNNNNKYSKAGSFS